MVRKQVSECGYLSIKLYIKKKKSSGLDGPVGFNLPTIALKWQFSSSICTSNHPESWLNVGPQTLTLAAGVGPGHQQWVRSTVACAPLWSHCGMPPASSKARWPSCPDVASASCTFCGRKTSATFSSFFDLSNRRATFSFHFQPWKMHKIILLGSN